MWLCKRDLRFVVNCGKLQQNQFRGMKSVFKCLDTKLNKLDTYYIKNLHIWSVLYKYGRTWHQNKCQNNATERMSIRPCQIRACEIADAEKPLFPQEISTPANGIFRIQISTI